MDDREILHNQLERLNEEHRELDVMIEKMLGENIVNQIAVQRLKKRKLLLDAPQQHLYLCIYKNVTYF